MSTRCPVTTVINTISKRWVMFILHSIRQGKSSFNEIKRANVGMSAKILSERLVELENEGYISRKVTGERPVKIEYTLTAKGDSLEEVLQVLDRWAIEHKDEILGASLGKL